MCARHGNWYISDFLTPRKTRTGEGLQEKVKASLSPVLVKQFCREYLGISARVFPRGVVEWK